MRLAALKGAKVPNLFPLRTSIEPKYVLFDTKTVIMLLLPEDSGLGPKRDLVKNITANKDRVWGHLFNLQAECFSPSDANRYTFGHSMRTDGIAVSILWEEKAHQDAKGARLAHNKAERAREKEDPTYAKRKFDGGGTTRKKRGKEEYVGPSDSSKKVVGVDPGKSDIIYCSGDEGKTFRYTQNQKRAETKEKSGGAPASAQRPRSLAKRRWRSGKRG
jgi:hypothetical protein